MQLARRIFAPKILLISTLLSLFALQTQGQQANDGDAVNQALQRFEDTPDKVPVDIIEQLLPVYEQTWSSGEAEAVRILKYKLAWAAKELRAKAPEPLHNHLTDGWPDRFKTEANDLHAFSGVYLYNLSEFGWAIAQFKAAEAAATDLDAKARALENVAVCHVQMNDLEEAVRYFEIAMSLREEDASPMSVNNLAGIYNQLNQPEKVLSVLALIDWSTVSGPAKRMAWINRLSAARTIDPQSEETQQAYKELITAFPVPKYPQEVATVVRAAVMIGDSGHVKKMLDASQALIDQHPALSAEWMPDLKPLFRIGENWGQLGFDRLPWATRWALTRELSQTRWDLNRKSIIAEQAEELEGDLAQALTQVEQSTNRLWIVVAFSVALIILLGMFMWQRIQVQRLRARVDAPHRPLSTEHSTSIAAIRDAITEGRDIQGALLQLAYLNDVISEEPPVTGQMMSQDEAFQQLTGNEQKLLEHILRGYSSKESSVLMKVTPGHIYNMRSSIREKLNIEKNVDVALWLKQRYRLPRDPSDTAQS